MARRRLPRSLPQAETLAILAGAGSRRDRLLISAGLYLGLRVSEITKLEVPDLDLDEGTALIREAKGGRDRCVPIPAHLVAELRAWLAGRATGHVFPGRAGGRLSSRTVQRVVKRAAAAGSIPDAGKPRRVHPHRLRHSCATEMLRAGVDIVTVRDLLGHSSVATTQLYLSSDATRLREASAKLAARLGQGPQPGGDPK